MTVSGNRRAWLGILSCAEPVELMEALEPFRVTCASAVELRRAEVGLALVTGRTGATGTPFGLGEMTLTRCVVQVGNAMGVGYVRGRAPDHARNVALADALLQGDDSDGVHRAVVVPLAAAHARRRAQNAADVDTSRVQFLTMVRGE